MDSDLDLRKFEYQMLSQRSTSEHSEMWQTPSLAITAEAFLLTVAMGSGVTNNLRIVACSLGVLAAAMSMQLMAKHRFNNNLDRVKMSEIEDQLGILSISERRWTRDSEGRYLCKVPRITLWLTLPSYLIWQLGLAVFLMVNLVIGIVLVAAL